MKTFYYWMIANLGWNPKTSISFFLNFPRYVWEYFKVARSFKGKIAFLPYLNDRNSAAGNFLHEYFIQDVFAAQLVHELNPIQVVDVGSRIDGYIGHLISFRRVELIDIRPVESSVKNLEFLQANFSDETSINANYTDFISCLHSIEHFGLGRYGDPIDLMAVQSALRNFYKILKPGGYFLLSTTFGNERIEFNKQWVFDFESMLNKLRIIGFHIHKLYYLNNTHFTEAIEEEITKIASKRDTLVILLCNKT